MQKYIIALYIRLSLEDSKYDSLSIENQRMILNEFALSMPEAENAEFPACGGWEQRGGDCSPPDGPAHPHAGRIQSGQRQSYPRPLPHTWRLEQLDNPADAG